jgi:endo-beta-N-acetylglucosaminidase D
MLYSILKRYPELTEDDVMIVDRSDGKGPFIAYWNSDKPKPTTEQLLQWAEEDAPEISVQKTDIELLEQENANLILQNAMQDIAIQSLQDENAELMLKIAMLEANANV